MSTSIISGIISKYFQHLQQAFKKHQKHQKLSKGDTENLGINAVQAHRRTFQDSQEYQWQQALAKISSPDIANDIWVRHPICFPTSKWDHQTVLTRTKGPSRVLYWYWYNLVYVQADAVPCRVAHAQRDIESRVLAKHLVAWLFYHHICHICQSLFLNSHVSYPPFDIAMETPVCFDDLPIFTD